MTNDPYPTLLPPEIVIPLSLALNIGAPVCALMLRRWWPHVVVCFWEIISFPVAAILAMPKIPSDEAPGPGDGLVLVPVVFTDRKSVV